MPGFFFHAKEAIDYFNRFDYKPIEAQKMVAYSVIPDIVWGYVNGITCNSSHDRKALDNIREYDKNINSVPWLYEMMLHHITIDHITDNMKHSLLNDFAGKLEKKVKSFGLPEMVTGIFMDISLDIALYEKEKAAGNDLAELLTGSQAMIEPHKVGDALGYCYNEKNIEYIDLCHELQNLDFLSLTSTEGMLDSIIKYYLNMNKRKVKKMRIGEGKAKNWFRHKGVKLLYKKTKNKIFDIANETKEQFIGKIDEIHYNIAQNTPPPEQLFTRN